MRENRIYNCCLCRIPDNFEYSGPSFIENYVEKVITGQKLPMWRKNYWKQSRN